MPGGDVTKNLDILDVRDFGAKSGVDISVPLQRMITEGIATGHRRGHVPAGHWPMSVTVTIPEHFHLTGAGMYQTRFAPDPGVQAFRCRSSAYNGLRAPGATTWNGSAGDDFEMGVQLEDFAVFGTDGQGQRGIEWFGGSDHGIMNRLYFGWLANAVTFGADGASSTALGAASVGFAREFTIRDCVFSHSGVSGSTPAVLVRTDSTSGNTQDGTNHLAFEHCRFVYNRGNAVKITNGSTTETIRRITFHACMLHGLHTSVSPTSVDDIVLIEGAVFFVDFSQAKMNGSPVGTACIRVRELNGIHPRGIRIQGNLSNSAGDGIVIEKAQAVRIELQVAPDNVVVGDAVRFTANSMIGAAHLDVLRYGTVTVPLKVNVHASVLDRVSGWIENEWFNLPTQVTRRKTPSSAGQATLQRPGAAGPATWV